MGYTYLDFMRGKAPYPFVGKYFEYLPESIIASSLEDVYKLENSRSFGYKHYKPSKRSYNNVIGNLSEKKAVTAHIQTNDNIPFEIGGYIITQDLKLYQITDIDEDQDTSAIQSARMLAIPSAVERYLKLEERENPWGII